MGLRVGDAPEGRSAARVYLGTTGEIARRASARASLLSLTPPTAMPALPDPPQHTHRRDPALTSTCRRVESQLPARDDVRLLAPRSRLCSLRSEAPRWVLCAVRRFQRHRRDIPARAERRQPPGGPSVTAEHSQTPTYLGVLLGVCRAPPREASKGGRMRAVLLSARRAKPAGALT